MRILVTGATGFIGRYLCHHLVEQGHDVRGLSRSPSRALAALPAITSVAEWRPLVGPPPKDAFRDVDAVVNLAGETVAGRWTAAKRDSIRNSRVLATRHLIEGVRHANEQPSVLISASAVGYYGDRGEEELTEDSSPGTGFLADMCCAWEAEAQCAEDLGIRVVRVRIGIVLGHDGGALASMLPLFRRGLGGPIGSGKQWWPWVHIADLCRLVAWSLADESISGAVNAVSAQPVRQAEFARTLGAVLRRPAFLWTPAIGIRLAVGGFAEELLGSKRVLPARSAACGHQPSFADLRSALFELVGAIPAKRRGAGPGA